MDNIVIVGCGDHFRSNLAPSLSTMIVDNEVKVIATVDHIPLDVNYLDSTHPIPHIVRQSGQSLSACLLQFKAQDPIVLLAHSHDQHTKDTCDLVASGFRIIVEKPYAIKSSELETIHDLLKANPKRIALAEYYLMMKAAPLLHSAGLLLPDSFYIRDKGYLHLEGTGNTFQNTFVTLQNIGRSRTVFIDILEGEGATGRFEHRGLQFADTRVGIGVILDLAIHAFAPLLALEDTLGRIPSASEISIGTSVCSSFLSFAKSTYGVPPEFVPETYAELAFTTSMGVPVVICVGKYVLPNINQRRMLIIGDEGEALLDLSSCSLSLGYRDQCPTTLLSSPKRPESKYRAVIKACLKILNGMSPYSFNPSNVAIRCNEVALSLYSRACDETAARNQYPQGAVPGTILQTPINHLISNSPSNDFEMKGEPSELYYKHQYDRMTSLEDQGFKMSGGVFLLTVAVFTFLSRTCSSTSIIPWKLIIIIMSLVNLIALFYMWRVNDSIYIHRQRAKEIIKNAWPSLWGVDLKFQQSFTGRIQLRPLIQAILHLVLIAIGLWILWNGYSV